MRSGAIWTALAVSVWLAPAAASAAGTPTWFGLAPFPDAGSQFVPRVAEAPNGDVLSAWVGSDGNGGQAINVASLPAGPGSPTVISSSRGAALADALVYPPALAIAPTGDALVAWKQGAYSLGFRLRQAPGGFGDPQVRSTTSGKNASYDTITSPVMVAADRSGNFTIAYGSALPSPHNSGGNLDRLVIWNVDASTGLVSGPVEVGATTTNPPDSSPITDVALGVSPDGNAVVAYRKYVAGQQYVEVSVRDGPAASWTPPGVLDFSGDQPRVAVGAGGRALVAWRHVGGDTEVRAEERSGTGTDLAPVGPFATGTLSDPTLVSDEVGGVALDAAGDGTVVWQTAGPCTSGGGTCRDVRVQDLTPAGALNDSTQTISGQSTDPYSFMNPQVAVTPAGRAVVVWKRFFSGHSVLEFARRDLPGAGFRSAAAVPGDPEAATPAIDPCAELAVDAAGDAAVAWEQDVGMRSLPHLARLDASAPDPGAISVSGQVGRFVPLLFSVTPHDRVSAVSVRWSFGDGGTARGLTVRHVYTAGSRRTVTATVTDAAGYSSVVTRVLMLGGSRAPRFLGRPAVSRRGAHLKISWRLNVAATVAVTVSRQARGHRRHGRCQTKVALGPRCTISVKVLSRSVPAGSGSGSLRLSVGGWPRGSYVIRLVAISGAGRSSPTTLSLSL